MPPGNKGSAFVPAIRDAAESDLPFILGIVNEAIQNTTAIWDLAPMTLDARRAWFAERRAGGFPILIAEDNGTQAGFGSYGQFHPKEGYRLTVEHSVYVAPQAQGRGVGRALLTALTDHAATHGFHTMVGLIEAENKPSLALHRWAGFAEAGVLRQAGRKFGRWLDVVYMQKMLSAP